MANDNTLGAPTQGLGQTVTFAFDPGRQPAQIGLGGSNQINGRVVGAGGVPGGVASAGRLQPGIQATPNPTLDILTRFADKAALAAVDKAKQEAFFNGMQRAAAGEAVADIVNTTPWYATLFGEADVVEGARAYAGNTVAQTAIADMADKMPELRRMPPEEAQAYFNQTISGKLTGDKPTDASILQAFTRAMPGVMRQQAKEHYGWKQENAVKEQQSSIRAQAQGLAAQAKGYADGFVTEDEFKASSQAYVRSLLPAAGQDEKHYKLGITGALLSQAQDGNFHALNAARDSGLFDALDEDQRLRIEKAVESGEGRLRTRYSFDWNDDLAKIKAQAEVPRPGQTATDLAAQIDALNERFRKTTGSRGGLITPESRAAMVSGSAVAITREYQRQAEKVAAAGEKVTDAAQKAAAAEAKATLIGTRVAAGQGVSELAATPGISREEVDAQATRMYATLDDDAKVKLLAGGFNSNHVYTPIKQARVGSINAALSAGKTMGPDFQAAFAEYSRVREQGSPELADAYYGEYAPKLEGLYMDMKNGLSPEGAFQARFIAPSARANLSDKDMQKAVSTVSDEVNDFLPEWMGGTKLKPGQARRIVNESADLIKQFAHANGDIKEATKRAWKSKQLQGLETLGGYVWNNSGQQSLSQWLTTSQNAGKPIGTDKINEEFDAAVEAKLFGHDAVAGMLDGASDVSVFRLTDQKGEPVFHLQAVRNGEVRNGVLRGSEIFATAARRRESLKAPDNITGNRVVSPFTFN